MKKYMTPVLTLTQVKSEGLMTLSQLTTGGGGTPVAPGTGDTFEKQFSIWGDDDYYAGSSLPSSDEMDFNSTGIF